MIDEIPIEGITYAYPERIYTVAEYEYAQNSVPNKPSIGLNIVDPWHISPSLPYGLVFDEDTGVISGMKILFSTLSIQC